MYYPPLGGNAPEAIDLGRLIHEEDGISNKIRYPGERHLLVVGTNGCGKGTRILLPNLLNMRGARSLVVVDPKGELAAVSVPFRAFVGRVAVLNPFGVLTDRVGFEDMVSVGCNPLIALNPMSQSFNSDAGLLAEAMIPVESKGENRHFDLSARSLVTALIMWVVIEGMKFRRVPTIARMRELLCSESAAPSRLTDFKGKGLPLLAQEMVKSENAGLRNLASQFTEWNKEIQSIVSTAKTNTVCFDDPEIAADLAKPGLDWREIKREPTTVYLILPPQMMERHSKWLRLMLTAALQASMRAREAGEPRILFMLDEFAALGHLKIIETVWALVRGYGIQIMPVLQDLNQLKSLYEQRWETFLGNAGAAVFFAPNDATTAAWLETRLGNTTRMVTTSSTSESTNTGENSGEGGSSGPHGGSESSNVGRSFGRSNSSSSNTAPVKVPLMTARRLHGLKPGELWLVMAGKADAAKVFAPHYFNIGDRTKRARVNPYFQPVPRRLALPAGGG